MIKYCANPVKPAKDAFLAGQLAMIITPKQGNKLPRNVTWCADNGCGPTKNGEVGSAYPGDTEYLRLLVELRNRVAHCLFATAPDVVGNAAATLERSAPMLPRIRQLGYPAAFVAQNGQEALEVPWDTFDVLFIGGSLECPSCGWVCPADDHETKRCPTDETKLVEWKLGAEAYKLIREAKSHGKQVHMGRVNSFKRLSYSHEIGCDSADGTYLTFGPDKNLPVLMSWLGRLDKLEDEAA